MWEPIAKTINSIDLLTSFKIAIKQCKACRLYRKYIPEFGFTPIIVNYSFIVTRPHRKNLHQNAA